MRRSGIYLLLILTFGACEREGPEVSFRIETRGFFLEEAFMDKAEAFPEFEHRVSGGKVIFTRGSKSYEFFTGKISIEDFEFRLPAGTYHMEFEIPQASLYGQPGGSFSTSSGMVTIDELNTLISIHVESNCSLFLVNDDQEELEEGIFMIERHSYAHGFFWSYPLERDSLSGLYYAYFTPDTVPSNPSAFLWFYGDRQGMEEGGLATTDFEIGYQYNIKVLD